MANYNKKCIYEINRILTKYCLNDLDSTKLHFCMCIESQLNKIKSYLTKFKK